VGRAKALWPQATRERRGGSLVDRN
jgi:hypothetical protein